MVFIVVSNQLVSRQLMWVDPGDGDLVLICSEADIGAQGKRTSRGCQYRLLPLHMWTFLENNVEMGEVAKVKIWEWVEEIMGLLESSLMDQSAWLFL